eukprot:symbB.v1.2.011525.t1/scaffold778.1/size163404/8
MVLALKGSKGKHGNDGICCSLNKLILGTESCQALVTLVGDRGQEFDYVNTATALQRAAKLQGNPSQLRPILEMVQQQLPSFKPFNLATASWSFARLQAAILLTGYNPWGNFTQNPSGEVAEALNGTIVEELEVHSIRIDVSEEGVLYAESLVKSGSLNDRPPWDAVVHLGFEDEAKGLKLETMAFNMRALKRGPVHPDGPHLLPTTGDLGAVALNTKNPHELWSRDAGTFFCNEIYFRSLYWIRESKRKRCRGALVPCLFIHIPPLHLMPLAESSLFVKTLLGDLIRASGCPTKRQWWHVYG